MERRAINPWTWQDNFGFVQANEVTGGNRILLCAGQTSVDESGTPVHEGDMVAQAGMALDNLEAVLKGAGMTLANVVRLNYYTTDVDAFFGASAMLTPRLQKAGCKPASTLLGVARLAFPQLLIEIEATAVA
jgi:enamine deaminase RidA (YjgF/YER057c/UK114 family)